MTRRDRVSKVRDFMVLRERNKSEEVGGVGGVRGEG